MPTTHMPTTNMRETHMRETSITKEAFIKTNDNNSFALYLEPILNPYYQSYQNVVTLSGMPAGPLGELVSLIKLSALSPFQNGYSNSPFSNGSNCAYVLCRFPKNESGSGSGLFKNADNFMGVDDIPSIFSYLQTSGYHIDTSLSKMLFQSRVVMGGVSEKRMSGDRRMIAMVSIL